MTIQDYFYGTRKTNLLLPTAISSATVTNTSAVELKKGISYVMFLDVTARSNGSVQIQDIQLADDSSFTENVSTFSASSNAGQVLANDRSSTVDAFTQTVMTTVGTKAIHFRSLATNGQKFMRARLVTVGGTVSLTTMVQMIALENEAPINPVQA